MSTTELVRPQYGTHWEHAYVAQIKDGPYTRVDDLNDRLHRLEGWVQVPGLRIKAQAIMDVCRRFHPSWPWRPSVRFAQPDPNRKCDGWLTSTKEDGCVVNVYLGLTAQRTVCVIKHELAHADQLRRLGEKFDEIYLSCQGELEAEADEMARSVADIELVRAA